MAAPIAAVAVPAASSVAYSTLNAPEEGYIVERDLGVVFGTAIGPGNQVTLSVQKTLRNIAQGIEQTLQAAMANMGQQCVARGGNIVLGVSFTTERINGASIVTCWGTACVGKPKIGV